MKTAYNKCGKTIYWIKSLIDNILKHIDKFGRLFFGRAILQILVALAVLMLLPGTASAKPLLVVVDEAFAPFTFKNQKDEADGLHVEITKGALINANIDFEILLMPWKRIVELTEQGKLDISVPWRHKEERFKKFNMIGPFTMKGSRTYFWAHKDSTISWKELKDLEGKTIAGISGFAYPSSFENAGYLKKTMKTGDTEMLVRLVHAKRYELIVSDETALTFAARNLDLEKMVKRVGAPLESVMRYAAVPKKKKRIAKMVAKAFSDFRMTHEYQEILKKYIN